MVLVTKKDGTTHFYMDYTKLNDVTRKDAYPLSHIDDTLDRHCTALLTSANWISIQDISRWR